MKRGATDSISSKTKIWGKCIKNLFNSHQDGELIEQEETDALLILKSKVEAAIKPTKIRKAATLDNIKVKLLKILGPTAIKKMTNFFNSIYSRRKMPEEWLGRSGLLFYRKP